MDEVDKPNIGSFPSGLSSNHKHAVTSAANPDGLRWVDGVGVRFCSVTLVFLCWTFRGSYAAAVVPNYTGFTPTGQMWRLDFCVCGPTSHVDQKVLNDYHASSFQVSADENKEGRMEMKVERFNQRWNLSLAPSEETMLFFCVSHAVCCVGTFGGTEKYWPGLLGIFLQTYSAPQERLIALRQLSHLQVRSALYLCLSFVFFSIDTEPLDDSSSQSSRISLIWQFSSLNPKRGKRKKTNSGFAFEGRCWMWRNITAAAFLVLIVRMFLAFCSSALNPCVILQCVVKYCFDVYIFIYI